ncbi:Pkinase-domain-containing protein [Amniculicola lignicola CBS 123094]|uniref:non-specific serine/threonine protein kinase n=1 Tax=Amniculicola lignicola CBS 123094 TaxID=1392246 RepID=A0A6A5W9U4_9PLEO|nr:Pkinase-domain-containing protein [Amniculicola lignicola CBS 123094]
MSSAAVQAMSAGAPSPHSREQYYAQQSPAASSPASSRNKQRAGGNGSSNTPTTPQAHHSPAVSSPSNLNTPRAQPLPPSTHNTPTIGTPAMSGGAPMPPPRTSSHRSQPSAAASSPSASRAPPSASHASSSDKDRTRDDSRRRGNPSSKDSPRHQGSSSRSKPQPSHSRSANAVGQTPTGSHLPREESAVISRMVVTDPQEDIARAEARQAENITSASGAEVAPIAGLGLVGSEGVDDGGRGGATGKSRQDHSKSETSGKRSRFGSYILGQTLGEGEFGKVKMGWKKDSNVEVAIKLIRRETLGGNQNRLQKIYREIHILRGLEHPNIVRLHEMVETERHIGIILEYASGGELFDYILNHRYLKDGAARRLFAQLISGVGYLHKKGIVHRDLKLENLLLDRNRNIIITDFGFANTFDPNDELSEDIEYNLGNKEFIRSLGLEGGSEGVRRGDLMQTSCGSPCYAAPELVVSDSLYTGRKVDVWSCGVILYAMLAGYLPFDDDPANPEGDNINLLYKYIVSTPLTFPEYVTPHARDLLKRILVPDPRKRADLFEVARHSWLSDYAHVVSFITSSANTPNDVEKTPAPTQEPYEQPSLARSASVREPVKPNTAVTPVGGLTAKRDQINRAEQPDKAKTSRDNKRRTVQVEYVAPQSQTVRGEASPPAAAGPSKARVKDQGPIEVPPTDGYQSSSNNTRQARSSAAPNASTQPARPARDVQRSVSDHTAFGTVPVTSANRPSTGGTLGGGARLPSRGNSYGQPAAATVAQTNAEGRFSQPKGKKYSISGPISQPGSTNDMAMGRPSTQRMPSTQSTEGSASIQKGHRRSNTVSDTIGRVTSMFSGRQYQSQAQDPSQNSTHNPNKVQKSYPPTSMPGPMGGHDDTAPRQSMESSRRTSFGFNRKTTDQSGAPKASRRFSLLPSSLSKTFTSNRESMPATNSHSTDRRASAAPAPRSRGTSRGGGMAFGRGESRSPSQSTTGSNMPGFYDGQHDSGSRVRAGPSSAPPQQTNFDHVAPIGDDKFPGPTVPHPASQPYQGQTRPYHHANDSEASEPVVPVQRSQYPQGFNAPDVPPKDTRDGNKLQKSRKFADAYDDGKGHHSGSSGSAKRVMDLFRRIGRQRTKDER